jgi:nitroimidazol reductase NimA-like FMN-containing flavoprotein (pyridoxamine 5'-phosphate oxidase superfamily)
MEPTLEIEPGDLARRITHRRQELGLTTEDLARQADVDPGFLEYFEGHSDVQLGRGTLSAIARVLQTSPASLLGGDRNRALGSSSALPGAILEPLTPAQCRAHLGAGGVGRVIFLASRGPVAFPVNYRFSNNEVLFNTTVKAARELESQALVGFEIDRIDDAFSEGWSVIVTGSARQVDHPDQLVEHAAHAARPWAGGARGAVVAITLAEVTGRVILHDGTDERTAGWNPSDAHRERSSNMTTTVHRQRRRES